MIEREEVRSIVQEVLEEEHLHNFTKIFEKEHNLFRGTHDKMAVPPAVVENYYTQQVVDSKTHWEREGDNIYYNDGRVGVRTSTPTHLVQIDGTGLDDNAGSLLVAGGTQQFIQVDSASRARFICDAHDADASIEFQEDDTIKWVVGFDYTDTLAFTVSEGVPGTNNRLKIAAGGAVTIGGTVSMASGSTIGTLTLADGSITDSGGTINFGNENLTGSGNINLSGGASQFVQIDSTSTARFIADAHLADALFDMQLDNVTKWVVGFDYTDTNAFTISEGTPGTNNRLKIASGGNITAGGTLSIGEITVIDGSGINLQEDITFTGATTENLIKMPDNLPVALDITEAGNPYLRFITTNGSEVISIHQDIFTDRWISSNTNFFLGVNVAGAGNLSHTTGDTGYHNMAIGYQTLKAITTGYRNVAIGSHALLANTTGYYNVAIGMEALAYNIGGVYNMAIGSHACLNNTSGNENMAMGKGALFANSLGHCNTAIGTGSLYTNTGSNNTAIGQNTGVIKGAGDNNVLLGHQAGYGGTGAAYIGDTCVGYRSGYALTSGRDNVFLGFESGRHVTTGSTNVCIGYQAGETNLTTGSNQLWIENSNSAVPLIYGEFDNNLLRIHGTLYVEEAAGGDQIWLSHDGADAYFKTDDGAFIFQTDEGTNTTTYLYVQGKGTGTGAIALFDEDSAEYLYMLSVAGQGYIKTEGTSPSTLNFQHDKAQDIKCWSSITSGNPYFYIYGYKTAVGVKYGRMKVHTDGEFWIDPQGGGVLAQGSSVVARWKNTYFRLSDDKVLRFGSGGDYGMGYYSTDDELQVVDGSTLNTNTRLLLNATGKWTMGSNGSFANADLNLDGDGCLGLKETSTPTADANYGKIYTKNDNKLYCQTGDGVEHEIAFV